MVGWMFQMESPFGSRTTVTRAARLNDGEVAWARAQRLKEIQMWSIFREFSIYFIFLALLFLLAYSNADANASYQVQHLRHAFHNTRQADADFAQVSLSHSFRQIEQRCARRSPRPISTGTGCRMLSSSICALSSGTTDNHLATSLASPTTRPADSWGGPLCDSCACSQSPVASASPCDPRSFSAKMITAS